VVDTLAEKLAVEDTIATDADIQAADTDSEHPINIFAGGSVKLSATSEGQPLNMST
jgi:hypothetical protein